MRRRTTRTEPQPVAELAAIGLVDSALRTASRRGAFERDEAERLVRDVASCVHDPVDAAAVGAVVDDTVATFGEDRLVDHTRVVDALLDIRSVMQHRWGSQLQPAVTTDPVRTAALAG